MIKEECGSCAYFAHEQERCRRYPPTTHIESTEPISPVRTLWPTVVKEDWCGEYKQGPWARAETKETIEEGFRGKG